MALTLKQEKFVQGLLKGLSQRQAYKESYNAKNMKDNTIDNAASKLLGDSKVSARLEELQGKVRKKVEEKGLLSATDVLQGIADIYERNKEEDDKTAMKALELYGKYHKLFTDKVETEVKGELKVNFNIPRPKGKK